MMNPIGVLLRASGEVKRGFWWNIAVTVVRPLVIVLSINEGITVMVQALVALQVLLFLLHWKLLIKPISGLSFFQFAAALGPACITFFAIAALLLLLIQPLLILAPVYLFVLICVEHLIAITPQLLKFYSFIRGS